MRALFPIAGFAIVLGSPILAEADVPRAPPAPPRKTVVPEPEWKINQRRQVLFDEGQRLADEEKWSDALDRFREVVRLRSHPRVTLWMALCEERLGRLLRARELYLQAQAEAHAARLYDVEKSAADALHELTPRVPLIVVRLVPAVDAEVLIDGSSVPLRDGGVFVDPGTRRIVARAKGRKDYRAEVSIGPGEEKILNVSLVEDAPPMQLPPPIAPDRSAAPAAIAIIALGSAMTVAGTVVTGVGVAERSGDLKALGIGLLFTGTVGLGVAIPWAVISSRPAPAAQDAAVAISIAPRPGGAALGVRGTF